MIELYERLGRHCQTVNQLNRLHIALENWMTPNQWFRLCQELRQSPRYQFLNQPVSSAPLAVHDIHSAQQRWISALQGLFAKGLGPIPQPFARFCIRRHICCYRGTGKETRAKTLAVCFTGLAQRMMVPLPVFLQQIDASKTDVVLIRYPRGQGFRRGLEGVGESFVVTVAALGKILPLDQYSRRVAIGVSGGGLPAVLTALQLEFDGALSFSGGDPGDPRWHEALGYSGVELVAQIQGKAKKVPPLFLVYGEDAPADAEAARVLGRLLPATLVKVSDKSKPVGHVSLYPLLAADKLAQFLADTVLEPKQRETRTLAPLSGPRYFGIGFNKTGTTSLGRCFEALGLTPIAEPRSPHLDFRQILRPILADGDFQPALQAAVYFRSFQDRPWNVWDIYRHLDEKFPGSYFILTVRDSESWWNSVERWLTIAFPHDQARRLRYLQHLKLERLEKSSFIAAYEQYNQAVRSYFLGRDNFLVMNLVDGDGWEKLCRFLKLPIPDLPFPHTNRQEVARLASHVRVG